MIQSLALAELGNGVQVFGSGKDGGREATFRGPVSFPKGDGPLWDGYGIIQAKHREFPSERPNDNASWLISEIRSELSKFEAKGNTPPERVPLPKYFIIATNIRLSPEQGAGGLDRVVAELGVWETRLGLRGSHIWHFANISRMLETNDGIRRSFAGFITTGDVLSDMLEYFSPATAGIAAQIRTHAAQQLRAKQWVRLSDSGITAEDGRLRLSDIGIDLPATIRQPNDLRKNVNVVAHAIQRGDANLGGSKRSRVPSSVVIVGGPGQGKSTLAQLICQAYRVELVGDSLDSGFGPMIETLRASSHASLRAMGVSTPRNRRWPVFVELSKFGDAVAGNEDMTLLSYIASQIHPSGAPMKANELAKWRRDWPWALVLDGLDEVAALENRQAVVERISDFVLEASQDGSDVFIIATTRPQGYHDELAEFDPEQIDLRDLEPQEALEYALKITGKRHEDDPDLLDSVTARLKDASETPDTARLMRTPLQVTIISTLLERVVRIPSTRHALFDAYYDTIYARETGKAGRLGKLLETHRDDVDFAHESIGVALQARAERLGQNEALASDSALRSLFEDRLGKAGFTEAETRRLTDDLMVAARERVVLLVAVRQDLLTFEVRSLQEYMAARALSSGTDDSILDHIELLAGSAFWRNTLLLAIGRVFSQRGHLRDALVGRIRQLDSNTPEGRFLGHGERLALDVLEDDIALTVPNVRRALLAQALGILKRWPTSDLEKLATIAGAAVNGPDRASADIVKAAIEDAFGASGRSRISAFVVLRHWQGKPGLAGAFANRLLEQNKALLSAPTAKSSVQRLGDLALEYIDSAGLAEEEESDWRSALALLQQTEVHRGLTLGESASAATRPIDTTRALDLMRGGLINEEIGRRLMSAIASVPLPDAEGAIWLAQVLSVIDERRPVSDRLTGLNLELKESL